MLNDQNQNLVDETENRDVTDFIEGRMVQEEKTPTGPRMVIPDPQPIYTTDDDIEFVSLDGTTYVVDRSTIKLEALAANREMMVENRTNLRLMLSKLLYGGNTAENKEFIEEVYTNVRHFLTEFGFDPTSGYAAAYPQCSKYEMAIMFIWDANSVCNTMIALTDNYMAKNEEVNK